MKVKKNINNILRGSFLVDESSLKNWRIILFIVALFLIIISSAHESDKKVIQIFQLNKKKRELRAQYVDVGTILMRMKMESNIKDKVKVRGLKPAKTPPQIIKVTSKN